MKVADLFPRLAGALAGAWPSGTPSSMDLDSDSGVEHVLGLVVQLQNGIQLTDGDSFFVNAEALWEDVVALKSAAAGARRTTLDFIQLFLSTGPLNAAVNAGMLMRARDWALRAIQDSPPKPSMDLTFNAMRLFGHARSGSRTVRLNANLAVTEFARGYFYYSLKFGDLSEIGIEIASDVRPLLLRDVANPLAREALLFFASWVERFMPGSAPGLVAELESIASANKGDRRLQKDIGIELSTTIGRHSSISIAEHARHVLDNYADLLQWHERLQLLVAALHGIDDPGPRLDEIVAEIVAHHAAVVATTTPETRWLSLYQEARLFPIIAPIVKRLGERNEPKALARVLAAWRGAKDERVDDVAIVMPNTENGTTFVWPSIALPNAAGALGAFVSAGNAFLGTQITRTDAAVALSPNERIGVPDRERAPDYQRAVANLLEAQRLSDLKEQDRPGALIPTTSVTLPLQAALLDRVGWSRPIAVSMEVPQPDRALKKALIMHAGLSYAEMEVAAVRCFLEARRVVVETRETSAMSRKDFLHELASDWDIVWISGHGEFTHYDPHRSFVLIGDDEVDLGAFASAARSAPSASNRRLLVLNVCDGAAAYGHNGPPSLGLSVGCASSSQAVVSHLWPVETLPAACFGALLACELAERQNFFSAFELATQTMRGGPSAISRTLEKGCGSQLELIRRIAARSETNWNFADWGSAAFYE